MTLAVDDLAATLENPAIRAAMAFWSVADEDRDNAMCAVCLSGAMMLQAGLKPDTPTDMASKGLISDAAAANLTAVNACRVGNVYRALGLVNRHAAEPAAVPPIEAVEKIGELLKSAGNGFRQDARALHKEEALEAAAWCKREAIPALAAAGI